MLRQVHTRLYFEDEALTASDPIMAPVPAERRGTLVAYREMRGSLPVYHFDYPRAGENETVFLTSKRRRDFFRATDANFSRADPGMNRSYAHILT
jgi:hypothetical protein